MTNAKSPKHPARTRVSPPPGAGERATLRRRWVMALVALALLVTGRTFLDRSVDLAREKKLFSRGEGDAVPPEYILASSLLGGFRGVFLTTLWMRAQDLKDGGKYYELVDLYRMISTLQPALAASWRHQAWDLAYNVSTNLPSHDERVFWVFRGIDLLRKEAIPKNRRSADLYWELAWIFHHKIGQDFDAAFFLYREHLKRQVENALGSLAVPENWPRFADVVEIRSRHRTPAELIAAPALAGLAAERKRDGLEAEALVDAARELLEADPNRTAALNAELANAETRRALERIELWRVGRDIAENLGMDPAEMHRLATRLGPIDWRRASAHGLYWAELGERVRQEVRPDLSVARFVYLILRSAFRVFVDDRDDAVGGLTFFPLLDSQRVMPTLDLVAEALDSLERASAAKRAQRLPTVDVDGFRTIVAALTADVALSLWIDGRSIDAEEVVARLRNADPGDPRYRGSLDQFAKLKLAEDLEAIGRDATVEITRALILKSLFWLAHGDRSRYGRRLAWTQLVHGYASNRWPGEIAPLVEIQRSALEEVERGGEPALRAPAAVARIRAELRELAPSVLDR